MWDWIEVEFGHTFEGFDVVGVWFFGRCKLCDGRRVGFLDVSEVEFHEIVVEDACAEDVGDLLYAGDSCELGFIFSESIDLRALHAFDEGGDGEFFFAFDAATRIGYDGFGDPRFLVEFLLVFAEDLECGVPILAIH